MSQSHLGPHLQIPVHGLGAGVEAEVVFRAVLTERVVVVYQAAVRDHRVDGGHFLRSDLVAMLVHESSCLLERNAEALLAAARGHIERREDHPRQKERHDQQARDGLTAERCEEPRGVRSAASHLVRVPDAQQGCRAGEQGGGDHHVHTGLLRQAQQHAQTDEQCDGTAAFEGAATGGHSSHEHHEIRDVNEAEQAVLHHGEGPGGDERHHAEEGEGGEAECAWRSQLAQVGHAGCEGDDGGCRLQDDEGERACVPAASERLGRRCEPAVEKGVEQRVVVAEVGAGDGVLPVVAEGDDGDGVVLGEHLLDLIVGVPVGAAGVKGDQPGQPEDGHDEREAHHASALPLRGEAGEPASPRRASEVFVVGYVRQDGQAGEEHGSDQRDDPHDEGAERRCALP